jgi:hypothetical protein
MRYIKLFEDHNTNVDILKEISSFSYFIEDEGFKIVYFVTLKGKYTYALGSSYDISYRLNQIDPSNLLARVALGIVNDVPRTISYGRTRPQRYLCHEIVLRRLEENGLFDHIVNSFKFYLGDKFEIVRSSESQPPFIYFEPK